MLFEENNKKFIVYPGYGVAKIEKEISKEINLSKIVFLELKFLNRDVTILVPKEGLNVVGVRELSKKEDIFEIFKIFSFNLDSKWLENICLISLNRRSKDYQNRIRKGDLIDLANIYRDLKYIEIRKGLSFGEKAVLAQVEFLISEECSFIEKKDINLVLNELKNCCENCINGKINLVDTFLSFKTKDFNLKNLN